MDERTPNLSLPYIIAAQAQKHVTHNEALRVLDAIVQIAVADRDLAAPPSAPPDGSRYIVATSPTGLWAGQAGKIAAWQDGAWMFYAPQPGWLAYVADEAGVVVFNGTAWSAVGGGSINPTPLVGINATADTTNRLSVASPASLFTQAGTGGHQLKINKATATDTASMLWQTGYSGRAELGLAGDDNLHIKVSADGTTWKEAILVDRATGAVTFPFTTFASGGGAGTPSTPQGRLTLASATPVMVTSVSGATTVYYTAYAGRYIPLYNGAAWTMTDLGGDLSLVTTDATKSPAAAAANKLYDAFVWDDGGTKRLSRGPAWVSDAARGTGVGTCELERLSGFWVNKFDITNGPAARRGTYVGTLRTNSAAQVDWSLGGASAGGAGAVLGVWNAYNRVDVAAISQDSAASWTYSTAAWRAVNNSNGNRISFVCGVAEDAVRAEYATCATTTSTNALCGIGLDSTTALSAYATPGAMSGTSILGISTVLRAPPQLGWHYVQAIERAQSTAGTNTYYGTAGLSGVYQAGLYATVRM